MRTNGASASASASPSGQDGRRGWNNECGVGGGGGSDDDEKYIFRLEVEIERARVFETCD